MYDVKRAQRTRLLGLHLVGGRTDVNVAAVLVVEDGHGICWYNHRLVHGRTLDMVALWASMTAAEGWAFAALRDSDLVGLD